MADTKISALTASTTPLAGTEVLPIVQSGITKQVSVANLTAGRAVSADSMTQNINYTSARAASAPTYGGNYYIYSGSGLNASIGGVEWQYATAGAGYGFKMNANGGPDALEIGYRANSDTWTVGWQFKNDGNMVPAVAAKGINFTANTAMPGSTSRLLNWYEEGVFTATVSPSTSGTVTLNSSYNLLAYTRVGRKVTIQGQLIVSSVSSPVGFFYINFPFSIGSGLAENAGWVTGSVAVSGGTSAAVNAFVLLGSPGESAVRVYLGTGTSFSATSAAQLQANTAITISLTFTM